MWWLCQSLSTLAATVYVSSESEAQAALDGASPGDVIVVKNGNYADFTLVLNRSGTAEAPIVLRAESGGKVSFTGQSGFHVRGSYLKIDGFVFNYATKFSDTIIRLIRFDGAHHNEVVNCAFYSCGFDKNAHLILLTRGSTHNQIHHNYLENIRGQGIGVRGEADNTDNHIHHNRINGTWEDGEANGQEPIQIGQSQSHNDNSLNTVVEYNLIENMVGDADAELISNKTSGNYLRWNTFLNNEDTNRDTRRLELRGGNDCVVENNYFDGSGIHVYGTGHIVQNNYIKNAKTGIWFRGGDGSTYQDTYDCTVSDNLIVNALEYGILMGYQGRVVYDIKLNDNRVFSHTGTMYAVEELTQNQFTWSGNVGEGHAALKFGIPTGVTRGTVDTLPPLGPIGYEEVGPAWMHQPVTGISDVWLEAECGMVGALWEEESDPTASRNSYVAVAAGNNSLSSAPSSPSDRIDYQFEVSESGDYYLWGRVRTPSSSDDSFWIKVDNSSWSVWHTGIRTEWGWKKQSMHSLSAGAHQVSIAYREDGAQLDKLYITSTNTTPSGSGAGGEHNCSPANSFPRVDTWYRIENKATKAWIRPYQYRTTTDESVSLYQVDTDRAGDAIRFRLVDAGEGTYRIENKLTGGWFRPSGCSDVDDESVEIVQVSTGYTGDCTRWRLVAVDEGYYHIQNVSTGLWFRPFRCRDATDETVPITQVADSYRGDCTRWKFVEAGSVNARETVVANKESIEAKGAFPEGKLQVFPNPVQGQLYVSLSSDEPADVLIQDAVGRIIEQQSFSRSGSLDVSSLMKGIYLIRVQQGAAIVTERVLVK